MRGGLEEGHGQDSEGNEAKRVRKKKSEEVEKGVKGTKQEKGKACENEGGKCEGRRRGREKTRRLWSEQGGEEEEVRTIRSHIGLQFLVLLLPPLPSVCVETKRKT